MRMATGVRTTGLFLIYAGIVGLGCSQGDDAEERACERVRECVTTFPTDECTVYSDEQETACVLECLENATCEEIDAAFEAAAAGREAPDNPFYSCSESCRTPAIGT